MATKFKSKTADDIVAPPLYIPHSATQPTIEHPPVHIQSRYGYGTHIKPGVDFPQDDPASLSLTNQSDKDSTDINLLMARYEKTGLIEDLITGQKRQPQYGDFTIVPDYLTLQTNILRVNEAFSVLPASTRSRFKNDPAELISFLSDPQNDAEAIKLGLKPVVKTADSAGGAGAPPPSPGQQTNVSPNNQTTPPPAGGGK